VFWPLVIAVPAVGASPRSVDSLRGANVFDNWLLGGLVVAAPPGGRSPAAHHTVHVAGPQAAPTARQPAGLVRRERHGRRRAASRASMHSDACPPGRRQPRRKPLCRLRDNGEPAFRSRPTAFPRRSVSTRQPANPVRGKQLGPRCRQPRRHAAVRAAAPAVTTSTRPTATTGI